MMRYIIIILFIGAVLRINAASQNIRFHPDEALYASFARSAVVHGNWMLDGPLDKPPLSIYFSAAAMHFIATSPFGNYHMDIRTGEFAARLPNVFAGVILIAVIYALSQALWKADNSQRPNYIAPLLVALSPFAIIFSASAFTDMLMLIFMVSAILMVIKKHPLWSGVFLALAIATKPQGIAYLPLIIGMMWAIDALSWHNIIKLMLPLLLGFIILSAWDNARPETSIVTLARANYPIDHIIAPIQTWPSRLAQWLGYLGWLLGPPPVTYLLIGLSGLYRLWHFWSDLRIGNRRNQHALTTDSQITSNLYLRSFLNDYAKIKVLQTVFWLYISAFVLFHIITGVHIYDRYLLPLLPLLVLVIGQSITDLTIILQKSVSHYAKWLPPILSILLLLSLIPTAYQISEWQIDIGRDHYPIDRDGEIIQLADHLNRQSLGAIIYDPWLGWEMGYYLGVWSDKRRVHYPDVDTLIAGALCNPDHAPRYIIAPQDKISTLSLWLDSIRQQGFTISPDLNLPSFVVYQIIPPSFVKAC